MLSKRSRERNGIGTMEEQGGYTSSMILDVGQKKGVIILSNITALGKLTQKINELGPELMDVMAGDSGKENAGI